MFDLNNHISKNVMPLDCEPDLPTAHAGERDKYTNCTSHSGRPTVDWKVPAQIPYRLGWLNPKIWTIYKLVQGSICLSVWHWWSKIIYLETPCEHLNMWGKTIQIAPIPGSVAKNYRSYCKVIVASDSLWLSSLVGYNCGPQLTLVKFLLDEGATCVDSW